MGLDESMTMVFMGGMTVLRRVSAADGPTSAQDSSTGSLAAWASSIKMESTSSNSKVGRSAAMVRNSNCTTQRSGTVLPAMPPSTMLTLVVEYATGKAES